MSALSSSLSFIRSYSPRALSISALTLMAAGVLTVHGCSNMSSTTVTSEIETCEAIDKLVHDHANDFADIRSNPRPYSTVTIWHTDYEVIKDRCEIWGWGQNKFNYVCTVVSPNQHIADTRYRESISRIRSCLNNDWQVKESSRKNDAGVFTRFMKKDTETVVSVHLVKTPGIFASEWTTYATVGNYSKDL